MLKKRSSFSSGGWGLVGFCLPRRSVYFVKEGAVLRWFVLGLNGAFKKNDETCQAFSLGRFP